MYTVISEARSDEERDAVYRFRYRVLHDVLGVRVPGMDAAKQQVTERLDDVAYHLQATDRATGEIVGVARGNVVVGLDWFEPSLRAALKLDVLVEVYGVGGVAHTSFTLVDPSVRALTVGSLLSSAIYGWCLERGFEVLTTSVEPAAVALYQQLGFVQVGPPVLIEEKGTRIPMAMRVWDAKHLEKVESPFLHRLYENSRKAPPVPALNEVFPGIEERSVAPRDRSALWTGCARAWSSAPSGGVFDGLTDEEVASSFFDYPVLNLPAGARLQEAGHPQAGFGVLLEGELGVVIGSGRYVDMVLAGELCDVVDGTAHAVVSLVAVVDSKVLWLPEDVETRLHRASPGVAREFMRNMRKQLTRKLRTTTVQFVRHFHAGSTAVEPASELRSFDRPDTELQQIMDHARLSAAVEFDALSKLGLETCATIVDLGSGSGATTTMLADRFPKAQLIGIEPDDALRAQAEELASDLGMSDRCRFLAAAPDAVPLADGVVDACYTRMLMQHTAKGDAVIAEAKRLLRPEGLLVMVDVDEGGVVLHPEPEGLDEFVERSWSAQATLGGDRRIGRRLPGMLRAAAFQEVRVDAVVFDSTHHGIAPVLDLAFGAKTALLKQSGRWTESDNRLAAHLEAMPDMDEAWAMAPILVIRGRKT